MKKNMATGQLDSFLTRFWHCVAFIFIASKLFRTSGNCSPRPRDRDRKGSRIKIRDMRSEWTDLRTHARSTVRGVTLVGGLSYKSMNLMIIPKERG